MSCKKKPLILIELNEINFDIANLYIDADQSRYPALTRLVKGKRIRTTSEDSYDLLEPWIQWPSVHTTKTYAQHSIFRLGDIVNSKTPQIFEVLEEAGYKVGVISAMNAVNRLKNPAYFIPDPWTNTSPDGSWWSQSLAEAISQAVNDNSKGKITIKSAFRLALGFLYFARSRNYLRYIRLFIASRRKAWLKALFLDLFLHDLHLELFKRRSPDFSTLFLNAGAHIQHHYFFNSLPLREKGVSRNPDWYIKSLDDPLRDALDLYEVIVGDFISKTDVEVVFATGLSQKPCDQVKYYYRLNRHSEFLANVGIRFSKVFPRMTRDFLIEFACEADASLAQEVLSDIRIKDDGVRLFEEIDNRGLSVFVSLTYPKEILDTTEYIAGDKSSLLKPIVSFVAIKNGMHQAEGFAFFSVGMELYAPEDMAHVSTLGNSVLSYFGLKGPVS